MWIIFFYFKIQKTIAWINSLSLALEDSKLAGSDNSWFNNRFDLWRNCFCEVWLRDELKKWSSHLLDNLSDCLTCAPVKIFRRLQQDSNLWPQWCCRSALTRSICWAHVFLWFDLSKQLSPVHKMMVIFLCFFSFFSLLLSFCVLILLQPLEIMSRNLFHNVTKIKKKMNEIWKETNIIEMMTKWKLKEN